MATAYEGKAPYIFVSYSHKDKNEVLRYIEGMEQRGFRVWFDGGIEAGSEWPDYIANHLANSNCVLVFLSENFAESVNCRRELALAQDLEKEQLNVYIQQVELSMGLRMQLGLNQAIFRENFSTEDAFIEELCKAKLLADCIEPDKVQESTKVLQTDAQPVEEQELSGGFTPEEETPGDKALKKECTRLGKICALLEVAYIPLSVGLMTLLSVMEVDWLSLLLGMILPHLVIAVINRILFSRVRKKFSTRHIANNYLKDPQAVTMFFFLAATVCSVLLGGYYLYIDANFLLRLLIALGLNVVPFFLAGLSNLFLID